VEPRSARAWGLTAASPRGEDSWLGLQTPFLFATCRRRARVDRLDGKIALNSRNVLLACTFPGSVVHWIGFVKRDVRVSTRKKLGRPCPGAESERVVSDRSEPSPLDPESPCKLPTELPAVVERRSAFGLVRSQVRPLPGSSERTLPHATRFPPHSRQGCQPRLVTRPVASWRRGRRPERRRLRAAASRSA
jgi:hypothetical protein